MLADLTLGRIARLSSTLLAILLVQHALAQSSPAVPVFDLNVGLERATTMPGTLAVGTGQAGYLQLAKGHVSGILTPFPPANAEPNAAVDILSLRESLTTSDHFDSFGCAAKSSRIRTWFELVSPEELAADPSSVLLWITRGARAFRLVNVRDSALATSTATPPAALVSGLTPIGREVVTRILAGNGLVDVSRLSSIAFDEVIQLALASHEPVIATHVAAAALAAHPWNMSDQQLIDISRTGGLVALTFDRRQLAPGRTARIDHVVSQLKHLARTMGSDHVALGSGFETGEDVPLDLESATQFPRLAAKLLAAGLSRSDVERIFHENAERVLCRASATVTKK